MSSFKYHNGGRTRRGTSSDCVVRALAIATGKKYSTVYNWLRRDMLEWYGSQPSLSRERVDELSKPGVGGRGVSNGHSEAFLRQYGWRRERVTFPAGTTVAGVANYYKSETVLVGSRRPRARTSGHLCCIKKGVVLDAWDCRESLAVSVWRKSR